MDNMHFIEENNLLHSKLYLLKDKLIELEDYYEDMLLDMKKGFVIDNKVLFYNDFDKIGRDLNLIKNEIINEVIPNINSKLN